MTSLELKVAEEDYVKRGANTCPLCRSDQIQGEEFQYGDGVHQRIVCLKCKSEWDDELTVTSCSILSVRGEAT